jgi:hypothetical protein
MKRALKTALHTELWFSSIQASKFLLDLASTVTLFFRTCRDQLPYFCSFQNFHVFKCGRLFERGRVLTTTGQSLPIGEWIYWLSLWFSSTLQLIIIADHIRIPASLLWMNGSYFILQIKCHSMFCITEIEKFLTFRYCRRILLVSEATVAELSHHTNTREEIANYYRERNHWSSYPLRQVSH